MITHSTIKQVLLWSSLLLVLPVTAHTEQAGSNFTREIFFILVAAVFLVVALALVLVKRSETVPGSLPLKKMSIAAFLTLAVNTMILAIIYQDVFV